MQDLWKRDLAAALLMLKTEREALDLLSDILSDEEFEGVPRRWQVIKCFSGAQTSEASAKSPAPATI